MRCNNGILDSVVKNVLNKIKIQNGTCNVTGMATRTIGKTKCRIRCHRGVRWATSKRVIRLKIRVEITSQINEWANTDPQTYSRWDQVPRKNKHMFSTRQSC
jgi:hypothetical protein